METTLEAASLESQVGIRDTTLQTTIRMTYLNACLYTYSCLSSTLWGPEILYVLTWPCAVMWLDRTLKHVDSFVTFTLHPSLMGVAFICACIEVANIGWASQAFFWVVATGFALTFVSIFTCIVTYIALDKGMRLAYACGFVFKNEQAMPSNQFITLEASQRLQYLNTDFTNHFLYAYAQSEASITVMFYDDAWKESFLYAALNFRLATFFFFFFWYAFATSAASWSSMASWWVALIVAAIITFVLNCLVRCLRLANVLTCLLVNLVLCCIPYFCYDAALNSAKQAIIARIRDGNVAPRVTHLENNL